MTIRPSNVLEARYLGAIVVVLFGEEGAWVVEVRNVQEHTVVSSERFASLGAARKAFKAEVA